MSAWIELAFVLFVAANLLQLGATRISTWARAVAVQGFVLGAVPLLVGGLGPRLILIALGSVALKGIAFPWILLRTAERVHTPREDRPLLGPSSSLVIGILLLSVASFLGSRLTLPSDMELSSSIAVPVALFTVLVGLFLVITRRTALGQVVGYITLENGIHLFGIACVGELPALVELGVLLDVFVAVLVMTVAVRHVRGAFDHIDVDKLSTLKG